MRAIPPLATTQRRFFITIVKVRDNAFDAADDGRADRPMTRIFADAIFQRMRGASK